MCMAAKPPKLPPVPLPPVDVPVTPMQSPEVEDVTGTKTTGQLRKAKGRKGLKIDLTSGAGGSSSGLNIPL